MLELASQRELVYYREKVARATQPGLVALDKLTTTTPRGGPPSVRAMDVFQMPVAVIKLPLNVKATFNERQDVSLEHLEPSQDLIAVQGLESYVIRPRRDPPDVAHVVMRDGRARWIIQEGHTRLGAAKLRGESTLDSRVWAFTQDATGAIVPVPRGHHKNGQVRAGLALSYRARLLTLASDPDEDPDDPEMEDTGDGQPVTPDPGEPLTPDELRAVRRAVIVGGEDIHMRVGGIRSDGAYYLWLGNGLASILRGDRISPPVDYTVVERLGPWQSAGNTFELRRRIERQAETARVSTFLLGDRSKYPDGLYPNEQEKYASYRATLKQPSSAYTPHNKDGADTQQQFKTPEGAYTPERVQLHEAIRHEMTGKATPVESPVAYMMGGGWAAGKSTLLESGNVDIPENHVKSDGDANKALMPEYKERLGKDPMVAANVHEESSDIAKSMTKLAADKKYNVVMDGTGNTSLESLKSKVDILRAGGHRVEANYVTVDTATALSRAQARGEKTGRHVPLEGLKDSHRKVSAILPQAMEAGLFDKATLWDTNSGTPIRVATSVGKEVTVHDEALWNRFKNKVND